MRRRTGSLSCFLALVAATTLVLGRESNPQKPVGNGKNELPAFTAEREAAAMMFVRQQFSELADLLTQLKTANPDEYEKAIRELFRTSETLAETQSKDPRRYELDLCAWKVNSRVQLLSAKLGMAQTATLEDELKAAVRDQADVRIARQKLERERVAARLEKLDANIAAMEAERDPQAEKQFNMLLKNATNARAKAEKARAGKKTPDNKADKQTESRDKK